MPLSAENTARLQSIHRKVLERTATREEIREGIQLIQNDRVGAQAASTKSKTATAAAKAVVDPAKVLADLRAMGAKLQSGPVT